MSSLLRYSGDTMDSNLKCALHLGDGESTGDLKTFDEESWQKVKDAQRLRRKTFKVSKYFDINLRDECDTSAAYHSKCYKNFTAVRKDDSVESTSSSTKQRLLRSDVDHPQTSSSGVHEQRCLFCNNVTKSSGRGKREYLGSLSMDKGEANIREAAVILQDDVLLAKIGAESMISKEIKFHHSCRKSYLNRAERSDKRKSTEPSSKLSAHKDAFDVLKTYVQNSLIENEGAVKLTDLHARYLTELGDEESKYSAQNLCEKLLKHYPGKLQTGRASKKEGIIIFHHNLTFDNAMKRVNFDPNSVKEAAFYLRSLILGSQHPVPNNITPESLETCQTQIPQDLLEFFQVLYTGTPGPTDNDRVQRLVNSVCDDVIFATTRGRVKPGKHICLGLGFKSITGSRRVLEVLNRFGHSISYHTAETLETQIASDITDRNTATPDGLCQRDGLCTGLAWDNYDENTETLSGSGTLHDTVGICYQNIAANDGEEQAANNEDSVDIETDVVSTSKISKRTLKLKQTTLEPYRKKPKITVFQYEVKTVPRPHNFTSVSYQDVFWMMNIALEEHTPMWCGWNSLCTEDPLPKQAIGYMENINLPPTRLDVIAETMRISQKVAHECGEQYIVVTYDLAVAKPAMQIQATEAPMYDNIFICFGPFHILMAYFAGLGHILDGSGGPEILTETEVLAAGSLNGFLKGKHYNRCKRLHPMLATAFQVLHFRAFLDVHGPLTQSLINLMADCRADLSPQALHNLEESESYKSFMSEYTAYMDETLTGQHGSTAQFWMLYIKCVQIFLRFSRACRTNDLNLFTFSLGEMCAVFFAANRPNYAKWMVRYHLNLLNIENTHPGVKHILEAGALSVRRTDRSFSRTAVDLTLEQTINADAASRQTGIAAFSTSESARRRWMITRSARSAIVGLLLEKAGLKTKEDVTKTLKPHRIRKDNDDITKIITGIESTMNPFKVEVDSNLYCVITGKKVDEEIKMDLLGCLEIGEKWRQEFTQECHQDPDRFEKPVPRRKIKNFASAAVKCHVSAKDQKIVELRGTRDLFGRLLCISAVQKIDMSIILSFPLTPVPLSLAHVDGSMNKTDKSRLMYKLEAMSENTPPISVDVTLVDAAFFLYLLQNIPPTFGGIAKMLLRQLCSMSTRVDFVCDAYKTPSIKQSERVRRGHDEIAFSITGPDQKRPKEWHQALRSSAFKSAFFRFLAKDWENPYHADCLVGHEVFLAVDETCYRFTEHDGTVRREEIPLLHCQHEEADTRLIFHLMKAVEISPNFKFVVRSNDTDVMVLLMYHVARAVVEPSVWLDAGLSSNNTRRYINITQLASSLDKSLLDALPALHAFTGCDYTASFMNKGKQKPFDLIKKSEKFCEAFAKIGDGDDIPEEIQNSIESFVCAMYGKPKMTDIDMVRLTLFQQNYAPRNDKNPLDRIKGMNPSAMPPCHKVLTSKLKRANYVAAIWKKSHLPAPAACGPEGNGWELQNGSYVIKWYDGDQVPRNVAQFLGSEFLDDEGDDEQPITDEMSDDSENDEEWP